MAILRRIAIGLALGAAVVFLTAKAYEAVLEYSFRQAFEQYGAQIQQKTKGCPRTSPEQFYACVQKVFHHHA